MRPYVALILDSFREAVVSWTLWLLVVPITLILLLLAPASVREEVATTLESHELVSPVKLARRIRIEAEGTEPSPGKRVWSLLNSSEQEAWERIAEPGRSVGERIQNRSRIRRALNRLIESEDLYDADAWRGVLLDKETQALVEKDAASLDRIDRQRRNRLVLQAAFPNYISKGGVRVVGRYFGFDVTSPFTMPGVRFRTFISDTIVPAVSGFLLGNIGVFIAIMVTSSITPQLFEPGSLNLLFSKPIVRSVAFLAKFFGGCAYILLCTAYLNIGLWLIMGWRFGVWNSGWWTSIPVFLFIFAVYYSVSASVGAISRNAIVAVAAAVLFWTAGFGIAVTDSFYVSLSIRPQEISHLRQSRGKTLAVTRSGRLLQWDDDKQEWQSVSQRFGAVGLMHVIGPVWMETEEGERILVARRFGRARGSMFDRPRLEILSPSGEAWESTNGIRLPQGTLNLFTIPDGGVIAVGIDGIYRIHRWASEEEGDGIPTGFFFKLPRLGKREFEPIGPSDWALRGPFHVAIDPATGRLAVYDAGEVAVYRLGERGKYEEVGRTTVTADGEQGGAVAIGGSTVVCILVDGDVIELDATTLEKRHTYRREPKSQPRRVVAARDGSTFAVLYHNHALYLLRPQVKGDRRYERPNELPQRRIDAITFDEQGMLQVVHHFRRVAWFDPQGGKIVRQYRPGLTWSQWIYFTIVRPLDRIMPQPGELKNTAQYLMLKKETTDGDFNRGDIEAPRESLNPWEPLLATGVFFVLVLGLTCLAIERKDF